MPDSLWTFLSWLPDNPALTASVVLTLGVLLVNGWTDAPNAIAGAVVTGAMPFPLAAALAAVCNFGGALCVTAVNTAVAQTTFAVADFGNDPRLAGIALCAAMAAVVVWNSHQREPRPGCRSLRLRHCLERHRLSATGSVDQNHHGTSPANCRRIYFGPAGYGCGGQAARAGRSVPAGPSSDSRRHGLSSRGAGRSEIHGDLRPWHCFVPGWRGGANLFRAHVADYAVRPDHCPGDCPGGTPYYRKGGSGHGGADTPTWLCCRCSRRPVFGGSYGIGASRIHHPYPNHRAVGSHCAGGWTARPESLWCHCAGMAADLPWVWSNWLPHYKTVDQCLFFLKKE